jgi:hypothetical protein
MTEMALVRKGDALIPHSQEALDDLRQIPESKVIRAQLTVPRKQRSYRQLKLFMACCRQVADNTDDASWNTAEKVAEQLKLQLLPPASYMVTPAGTVHVVTQSIGFHSLGHLDACRFFDRAWDVLAAKLGVTVGELLSETADSPEEIAAAYGR